MLVKRKGTNQPERLHNLTCIYCGCLITEENISKEHVVARNFVPKGFFNNSWNLIANACLDCNRHKGDLENDISAILLVPLLGHKDGRPEEVLEQGFHKSKRAISRRTKKPVIDSLERSSIDTTIGAISLSLGFVAPPQISENRIDELAQYHITAIFYLLTYNQEQKRGRFWTDGFEVIHSARSPDWGNQINRTFAARVKVWPTVFKGSLAQGYFKAVIRKKPDTNIFSWALEWNRTMRVIGVFGDPTITNLFLTSLPNLAFTQISTKERYRREVPLNKNDDELFMVKAEA